MDHESELLLSTFISEAQEILGTMEEALLALDKDPSNAETLRSLFRAAHTLKGNSACLGMESIASVTHRVEDYFDAVQRGKDRIDPQRVTVLLTFVDEMRKSIAAATIDHATVSPNLVQCVAGLSAAPSAPAAVRTSEEVPAETSAAPHATSVRVETSKLDRALDLTGEISIARGRLRQLIDQRRSHDEISEAYSTVERLSNDLQELVMKLRMVPIGPFFRQYMRSVRDVAAAHSKLARLVLEGEDVEVDLSVIEHLRNPLTHMIRNAVDHGIEAPDVRTRRGKNEEGTITLTAVRDGGTIVIRIHDDGAGLNRSRIAARARQLGLLGESEKLADDELFQFIFTPGFTTAEKVTDMSGRGLGLDVVRKNVEELHGSVKVESREGTTFIIRLPLTVAIIDGFVVMCGSEYYVLPLDAVRECMAHGEADDGEVYGVANVRGEPLPFVRLRRLFGVDANVTGKETLVVLASDRRRAAVVVDAVVGERQLVIKPLGTMFQRISGLAGSAVLGSGRVAIVLDIAALLDKCVASVRHDAPMTSPVIPIETIQQMEYPS